MGCPFGTSVELRATADEGSEALSLTVRLGGMQCRGPDQSVVCTFSDYDAAVSACAVLRPRSAERCDATHGCAALLTLHVRRRLSDAGPQCHSLLRAAE